jgi:hypothetical protein
MSLHKIYNFVGYNNLGLILEQERKHWLLKPDKKLNIQDSATGSIFTGRLDNMGNEIVVETNKTDAYTGTDMFKFTVDMVNDVFDPLSSALPFNIALNGLMYECIVSSKVAYTENNVVSYKNYKMKFTNCVEVLIPFGDSLESSDVYSGRWIKTTKPPVLILPDDSNVYSIEIPIPFTNDAGSCEYYYPLEENMQPLTLEKVSNDVYVTEAVTDHTFIGYPIFWFTSTKTNIGPKWDMTNSTVDGKTLMYIASPGNGSKYNAQLFCNVDGDLDATPDGTETSDWRISCNTVSGSFTNTTADVTIPIDISSITFVKISTGDKYVLQIDHNPNDVLTLTSINKWVRSGGTAWSNLTNYDTNCYGAGNHNELIPLFDIVLDNGVTFMHNTTDVGYAGLHMSSEVSSETTPRYPYDLDKWDGIPKWINDNETGAPQHLAIYSIHNTPNYNVNDPKSRQTAAIILDPGKQKESSYILTTSEPADWSSKYTSYYTYDEAHDIYNPIPSGTGAPEWIPDTYYTIGFTNDERGRVYLLSNDDIRYENNATTETKKPARTIARICDIPTTLIQLTDLTGLAPTTVVDKKYVHSDACYTTDEKNKLYNVLTSRWVRPIHLDANGAPITEHLTSDNDFIFNNIDDLNDVDLENHNDFRTYLNLNSYVSPSNIVVQTIYNGGTGYHTGDVGVIIIGGTPLNFVIASTDEEDEHSHGMVTGIEISGTTNINLANFDMPDGSGGNTNIYGTSIVRGNGTGLEVILNITNYELICPKRGGLFNDLFALVKHPDGLWLYKYDIKNYTPNQFISGKWMKHVLISEAELSSITNGLSTTESYMTSIIPCIRKLPIGISTNVQDSITAFATPTFVNIVDETHVPYTINGGTKTSVSINKLVCDSLLRCKAQYHSPESIITALKDHGIRYDCYVVWKWDEPNNNNNTWFTYGIIYRSFNNLLSTDTSTLLPSNTLNYDEFVHSNEQTTIVWDVPTVGPMMWVYDPSSTVDESYTLNPDTYELNIKRTTRSWGNINFISSTVVKLVDSNGKLLFNISSNNPISRSTAGVEYKKTATDPMYQQPTFAQIASIGDDASRILPVGSWRLVYPRIHSYSLSNSQNGLSFDAVKMDIIRGENMGVIGDIRNTNGDVVNKKLLVLDRQSKGNKLRAYNEQTNSWDIV